MEGKSHGKYFILDRAVVQISKSYKVSLCLCVFVPVDVEVNAHPDSFCPCVAGPGRPSADAARRQSARRTPQGRMGHGRQERRAEQEEERGEVEEVLHSLRAFPEYRASLMDTQVGTRSQ